MVNWFQAWSQVRQSWSFIHHAYRCGWSLYDGVSDAWSQRGYAMAYAVTQVTPRAKLLPALH